MTVLCAVWSGPIECVLCESGPTDCVLVEWPYSMHG